MNSSAYFDVWQIASTEVVGDIWLTILLGLIIIYIFAAKLNFSYQVSMIIGILWLSIIAAITGDILIWSLVVFTGGLLFYYVVSSKLRRG